MPLARILTAYPDRARALSRQLQDLGYAVEYLSPEKAGLLRADLEIDFEICNQAGVLRRAAELARELGCIPDTVEALAIVAAAENSGLQDGAPGTTELLSRYSRQFVQSFVGSAEGEPEMVSLPPDLLRSLYPEIEVPVSIAALENREALPAENLAAYEPSALVPQHGPVNIARSLLRRAAAVSAASLNATNQLCRKSWIALQGFAREATARVQSAIAVAREAHRQRLAEAQRKQALARERAAELEAARQAAAARLQELLRERGGLTAQQAVPPQAPASASSQPVAARIAAWARQIKVPASLRLTPQMEVILMGVASACALFVLALAVNSFRARNTLYSKASQPEVPVIIDRDGAAIKPRGEAKDSPARHTALHKPSAQHGGNAVITRHIGDDVTIRFLPGSTLPPRGFSRRFRSELKPAAMVAPGFRRVSDLEN